MEPKENKSDNKPKNHDKKREMAIGTPLNPAFGIETGMDLASYYDSKLSFTGASVDEHRMMEQANELIGEEEIEQQRDNL